MERVPVGPPLTGPVAGRRGRRSGAALLAVVLLMLGATLLAHALLLLASLELSAGRAGVDVLRARLAAEAGARRVAADSGTSERAGTALWGVADSLRGALPAPPAAAPSGAPAPTYSGRLVRLSREGWLAAGEGEAGVARHEAALAVWVLDPAARVAEVEAVVVTGASTESVVEGAIGTGAFLSRPPEAPPAACDAWLEAVDSLVDHRSPPPSATVPDASATTLGLLGVDLLAARAEVRVSGTGTPGPAASGAACLVAEPWNWGDPLHPGRPCADHLAGVVGAPDLRVEGGAGQGLLVLEGDATLADVDFRGVIVARGRLGLEGRSIVTGLVRAGGGVRVGPQARIEGSACRAATALDRGALRLPVPVPGSGWIRHR